MKPSWDDAPEWAGWLAMDHDGEWTWFETEPSFTHGVYGSDDGGRTQFAGWDENQPVKEPRP